jgi:GT2 family glycosyltransferase
MGDGGMKNGEALPRVFCVIVNWNGRADTMACLETLMQQEYPRLHVVVVDNGSSDDSVERIRSGFPQVEVIETGRNLGFASGTNVGVRRALQQDAQFVWLLNNDTLAPPDTCSKLVARARQEPDAGAVGSVLYYMHDPARVQAWGGGNLKVWMGRTTHFLKPAKLGRHSYLTFASVLLRREALLRVGVLYEGFFMYWDDADFALRLTRAGYRLAVAEDTCVLHKEGGSAERRSALIDRFYVTAGMRFLKRHAAAPLLSMGLFLTLKLAKRLASGEWKNAQAVFLAIGDYWSQRRQTYTDRV